MELTRERIEELKLDRDHPEWRALCDMALRSLQSDSRAVEVLRRLLALGHTDSRTGGFLIEDWRAVEAARSVLSATAPDDQDSASDASQKKPTITAATLLNAAFCIECPDEVLEKQKHAIIKQLLVAAHAIRKEALVSHDAAAHADMVLNATEALYGFCGWLTCRDEITRMGATENCTPIADLIDAFCKTNNLPPVRDEVGWYKILQHPAAAPGDTK